jgi:Family of unknown function (DUF5329)
MSKSKETLQHLTYGFVALFLISVVSFAHANEITPIENQKIEYLINAIATLDDAKFIRNDSAYDAKTAADHLRLKLKNAGSKVKTADDFIRYCASVSSMSGAPYQIRFVDGRTITSESFLQQKLVEFQKQKGF